MQSKEELLIEEYSNFLNTDEENLTLPKAELSKLLKAFKRSNKQLSKIIKISDKQQEELKEISEDLNKKSKKIQALLNHADQGFLSFADDFVVDDEYSLECEHLLGNDIARKDIAELLYPNEEDKQAFLKEALYNVSQESDVMIKDAMLSLLPQEVIVHRRAIHLDYKILENQSFMIILTNITKEKLLEKKIAKEQDILKMIVVIVSDPTQFYDLVDDFKNFSNNRRIYINQHLSFHENLSALYRDIHTFKGSFSQLRMQNSVKKLHTFESKLSQMGTDSHQDNQQLIELLESADMQRWLEEDLFLIKEILGAEFFNKQHKLEVDDKFIFTIEDKITFLLHSDNKHVTTYEDILNEIQRAKGTTLNHALSLYPKLVQEIAASQEKSVADFKIIGGDDILVPIHFKPLIKSIVHIFRNAIDHGIETREQRLLSHKSEEGHISCKVVSSEKSFTIIISDDGRGIDREKLKKKVLKSGIYNTFELENMSEEELLSLIFLDNVSTNDTITQLSGRGIGMSAVKAEVEKLSGTISVESTLGEGSVFTLNIPTALYDNLINIASNERDNITIEYILSPVINRATTYLQSDMKINIKNKALFSYDYIDNILIKEYCSYIHISGIVDVSVCISYDTFLLDKILQEFNQGYSVKEDELLLFRESISKEVINIIVGNALFNPYDKSVLEITTPYNIKHDELVAHAMHQKIAHVLIDTEYGEMQILVGRF